MLARFLSTIKDDGAASYGHYLRSVNRCWSLLALNLEAWIVSYGQEKEEDHEQAFD